MIFNKIIQQAQIFQNKLKKPMIEFYKEKFTFSDFNNLIIINENLEVKKIDINESELLKVDLGEMTSRDIKDATNKINLCQKEIIGPSSILRINGIF